MNKGRNEREEGKEVKKEERRKRKDKPSMQRTPKNLHRVPTFKEVQHNPHTLSVGSTMTYF